MKAELLSYHYSLTVCKLVIYISCYKWTPTISFYTYSFEYIKLRAGFENLVITKTAFETCVFFLPLSIHVPETTPFLNDGRGRMLVTTPIINHVSEHEK